MGVSVQVECLAVTEKYMGADEESAQCRIAKRLLRGKEKKSIRGIYEML